MDLSADALSMASGVTREPIIMESFKSGNFKKTVTSPAAASTVLIASANPDRKAFTVYNNSTNSLYIGVETDVSGGNQIGQAGSNAGVDACQGFWGPVVYTGNIYARRNTGTGTVTVIEFI